MRGVESVGGEEEGPALGAVEASGVVGVHLGTADVLGRVGGNAAIDVGEAVETADGGETAVDGARRQAPVLHRPDVELDLGPRGPEDVDVRIGHPLEERPQVIAVGVEPPPLVAGEEGGGRQLGLVDGDVVERPARHGHRGHG